MEIRHCLVKGWTEEFLKANPALDLEAAYSTDPPDSDCEADKKEDADDQADAVEEEDKPDEPKNGETKIDKYTSQLRRTAPAQRVKDEIHEEEKKNSEDGEKRRVKKRRVKKRRVKKRRVKEYMRWLILLWNKILRS